MWSREVVSFKAESESEKESFFRFAGVGVVIVFCDSDSALVNQAYMSATASQMYQTNKQVCGYTVNNFPKTVSLLALNWK